MKQSFTFIFAIFCTLTVSYAQVTLPYAEDLESEAQGGTTCGNSQVFTSINWTNVTTDDQDWVIDAGGTSSGLTGPSVDYNPGTATGKYLYVESSSPCYGSLQQAILESDEFYSNGTESNLFFEFAYHLYGQSMGDLQVNVREVTGGLPGPWTGLDTLSGDLGDAWFVASYDLSNFIGDTFQIQFVSIAGPSFTSDMAIDDFKFFSIEADDAGILSIDGPSSPAPIGLNNVSVAIQNFGFNNLTSAMINWELNGVAQTPFAYTAPLTGLPTGSSEGGVNIGSANFGTGIFTVKAWSSMPNGVLDVVPSNDTAFATGCSGALRGTYTVGGPSADFADLTSLGFVLSTCGIDSHTVININPGFYNERLILESVPGTADTATLTIDGGDASLTTISNATFSTIYLNGTSYTTIKNLTIEATGTTDSYGIQMRDSASYNTIDSCVIMMDDTTVNLADVAGINASDTETSTLSEGLNAFWTTVSNCVISGGQYGIRFEGQSANRNVGNSFINNTMINVEDYGFYMDDQDSINIIGNTITGLRNGLADAIYCFDLMMFNISGNTAYNVPDYGIYISDGNFDAVPTSRGLISNNMISSTSDNAARLDDVEETDVFHNTFASATTSTTTGAIYINDPIDLDIRNNIFYCDGGFAFYTPDVSYPAVGGVVDFNNYFGTGANLIDVGTLYADLAAWQAADATKNISSVEGDPIFVNGFDDLHLVGATANDVGDNTVGIAVDIDGDVRPEAPSIVVDMGADEYTPLLNDAVALEILPFASNCGDNATEVSVIIRNLGLSDVTNMPIELAYSGPSSGTLTATYLDILAFGEVDTVSVGFINNFDGGVFVLDGFVNLAGDQNLSNDTFPTFTVEFAPAVPSGIDGYTCGTTSAVLGVNAFPGAAYDWFASNDPLDTIPVGTGPNFVASSVTGVDTYYVAYQPSTPGSLTTTFAGGSGCGGGNMFDINAFTDISMNALDVNTDVTAGQTTTVTVHYIPNATFAGNETNAASWTTLGSFPAVSAGAGNPTFVDFNGASLTIPAGQQYAIYVEYQADYTVGTTTFSNADMEILNGTGLCSSFGGTNAGRMFNGTVYYGTVGCSNVRTPVFAIASPGVSVDLVSDTVVCGNSLDLDAGTNADFYAWSTTDSVQSITVTSTGQYVVEVSDSVGCVANDTVDVTIQTPPSVLVGNDTTLCGDMFTIDATVDSSLAYLWSNGDTTFSIMVSTSGTYDVEVTDSLGCTSSDSLVLTLNPNPIVDLGNDSTLCGNLELNAGNPGATYIWSTGDTTRAIIVAATDNYSVVVTDGNGCEGTDSVDLSFLPDAVLDTVVSACGSFAWIDGNTYTLDTLVSFVIAGGAANGCDSIINLDLDVTIIDTIVTQAGATLTANAVGVSYQWVDCDNGNFAIAGATGQSFTATANGNYAVQITDNGCVVQTSCVNVTGLSIRGIGDASVMNLYPNPTDNMLTIDFGSVMQDLSVRVITVDGRTMHAYEAVNGQFFELSLADYPQGLYFVEVTAEDGTVTSLKVSKF